MDRTVTRRVQAALDRWRLIADDSAGQPLPLTAAGLFLRHVAELPLAALDIVALLVLLKHPLTATGAGHDARGAHLLHTRELELHLRKHGPVFPDGAALRAWGDRPRTPPARRDWAQGIAALLDEDEVSSAIRAGKRLRGPGDPVVVGVLLERMGENIEGPELLDQLAPVAQGRRGAHLRIVVEAQAWRDACGEDREAGGHHLVAVLAAEGIYGAIGEAVAARSGEAVAAR